MTRVLLLALLAAAATGDRPRDAAVEAVFLLNFGRFVTWPAVDARAPGFAVCVLGQDPFGPLLDAALARETIDGQPVVARRLTAATDARACRILFVSASEDRQLAAVMAAVDRASILTVSDLPRFVDRGGMIQFVIEQSRVRFTINLDATARAGLTVSSNLLRVAADVRTGKP
jgi:hypothetical protein